MVLTVTVNVVDNGDGTLTATPTYPTDVTFNNTYEASGSVSLAAAKGIDGRDLAADEFSFQLKEGATVLQTKTNAADGSITFDAINYSVADKGLHTYTITELPGSLGGVTFDPMVLTVTVDVVDNGDGTLTATPTYPADVTFNNIYNADGSIALAASKILTGRTLAAGEFSFQLKEGDTVLQTKTNAADGSVMFDAIPYTVMDKGLHTYTITEVVGTEANMHYDPLVLTVTVNVVDNGDGTLTATATYPENVVFQNEYLTPGVEIDKTVANLTAGDPHSDFAELEDGETAEYKLVVTNTGNTALNDVMVEDDMVAFGTEAALSSGGTATFTDLGSGVPAINLGTLLPGESVTITYTYVTEFADIAMSPITNTATVTGAMAESRFFPDGRTVSDDDDAAINVSEIPLAFTDIEITKQVKNVTAGGLYADMATGFAGDIFSYRITVTNVGATVLSDIVIDDSRAPVGGLVIRDSDGAELHWTNIDGKASLTLAELQPDESETFTYQYKALTADEGEIIENVAVVEAVFKPAREGYEDVTLLKDAIAVINVAKAPPKTGESGAGNTLAGLGLILSGVVILILRRRYGRQFS